MNMEMKVKIKNRKVELCQIAVPMIGNTLRIIHVTPKQLEKLNAIPVGKEGVPKPVPLPDRRGLLGYSDQRRPSIRTQPLQRIGR
jgi:hypothetical protein